MEKKTQGEDETNTCNTGSFHMKDSSVLAYSVAGKSKRVYGYNATESLF